MDYGGEGKGEKGGGRERRGERLPLQERGQEERESGGEAASQKGVGMACLLRRQNITVSI